MAAADGKEDGAVNGRQWQSMVDNGGNDNQGRIIIWLAGLGVESH